MKTWKIIAVAAFAVVTVALITTTALAYMGQQGTSNPYGSYGPQSSSQGFRGGMMDGSMGGMMGGNYGGNQYSWGYPQQNGSLNGFHCDCQTRNPWCPP